MSGCVAAVAVLLLDPDAPMAVGVVIASVAVAVGAAVTAFLLPARSARGRHRTVAPALRRGIEVTAIVGLLLLLRVVDGLTVITGGFIVLGFVIAEVILSARPRASSR